MTLKGVAADMRAVTIAPKQAGSLQVSDVADSVPEDNELLVDGLTLGVCGTDALDADK